VRAQGIEDAGHARIGRVQGAAQAGQGPCQQRLTLGGLGLLARLNGLGALAAAHELGEPLLDGRGQSGREGIGVADLLALGAFGRAAPGAPRAADLVEETMRLERLDRAHDGGAARRALAQIVSSAGSHRPEAKSTKPSSTSSTHTPLLPSGPSRSPFFL
jgi:hypothetical protein